METNEIMETVAEETTNVIETAEELVEASKKPGAGTIILVGGVVVGAAYGAYKGIKYLVDRHKAKKAAKDVDVEDLEAPGKIDEFDELE